MYVEVSEDRNNSSSSPFTSFPLTLALRPARVVFLYKVVGTKPGKRTYRKIKVTNRHLVFSFLSSGPGWKTRAWPCTGCYRITSRIRGGISTLSPNEYESRMRSADREITSVLLACITASVSPFFT